MFVCICPIYTCMFYVPMSALLSTLQNKNIKTKLPNSNCLTYLDLFVFAGYIDHRATTCNDESSAESNTIPTTPPSTYDHMLEGVGDTVGVFFPLQLVMSKILGKSMKGNRLT